MKRQRPVLKARKDLDLCHGKWVNVWSVHCPNCPDSSADWTGTHKKDVLAMVVKHGREKHNWQ